MNTIQLAQKYNLKIHEILEKSRISEEKEEHSSKEAGVDKGRNKRKNKLKEEKSYGLL
jgi:hypothetical protein